MSGQNEKAFEVKWRVENIESWLQTRNDTLYSPQFLVDTLMNTRWKLKLLRKWQLAEKYTCVTLQRDVEDDHSELIALNYELCPLACDGSPLKTKSYRTKFAPETVSRELNVKEAEILKEKKEAYLPEGVLIVCCKLWKPRSTISKRGQCYIRSVIGKKCITLNGSIDDFSKLDRSTNVAVNFTSPSSEISLASFDVHLQPNGFLWFERVEFECKFFSSYSCKLFALDDRGRQKDVFQSRDLVTLLNYYKACGFQCPNYLEAFNNDLQGGTLKLQLVITFRPGVESECIEYDNKHKRVINESTDLGNTNTSDSEKVHSSQLGCIRLSAYEETSCDMEENESSDEVDYFDAIGKRQLPSTSLKKDLTSLYNDPLFCDTKLRTDTETFPAHRNVLSARSPVFKKMFTTDMKEAAGECINVPDISSDTVRRMLQFLYTDCTGDLEMQSAKDLYTASDKYDIASLKKRCSSFMKKNLRPSNVCEVLVLADMHQDKDLEFAASEYVLNYDEEVFGSDEWKLFMQNYGSLAAQVMYLKYTKQ